MWKANSNCHDCGEPKQLHDSQRRCRYEQPGWIIVGDQFPVLNHRVLARRGKEVFVAFRKRESMPIGVPGYEWAMPYEDGSHGERLCIMVDIDHWRELRPQDIGVKGGGV